jgi:hypothetical protein
LNEGFSLEQYRRQTGLEWTSIEHQILKAQERGLLEARDTASETAEAISTAAGRLPGLRPTDRAGWRPTDRAGWRPTDRAGWRPTELGRRFLNDLQLSFLA